MGNLFTLTPDIIQLAKNGIDDLLNQLGKKCLLQYSPKQIFCPNCTYDPVAKKSRNIWISGGPISFPNGTTCPMCEGVGYKFETATDTITMLCHTDKRKWVTKLPPNVQISDGAVETKGYLSDLEKVLRAEVMIVQPDLSPYITWKYKLYGEPTNPSNIIQDRYFLAIWERMAG